MIVNIIGGSVVIIKLIHESGNDTCRNFGRQQGVKHFFKFEGPNVQLVNVGIKTNAGYSIITFTADLGPRVVNNVRLA